MVQAFLATSAHDRFIRQRAVGTTSIYADGNELYYNNSRAAAVADRGSVCCNSSLRRGILNPSFGGIGKSFRRVVEADRMVR